MTLRIGSGQKEFLRVQRNHQSFCCWSSSYWHFFNRKVGLKSSCLNRSFWNSFGSFISWNPWISFWDFWNTRQRYFCDKGNIDVREGGCRQICIKIQKTSDNAGGKPTRGFSLQHKTFSALNYAQDFRTTLKESLKRTKSRSGLHLRKVKWFCVECLCQNSQLCLSHRCKQWLNSPIEFQK